MLQVIGNHHKLEIQYAVPEWGDKAERCISYRGSLYFLSEFVNIEHHGLMHFFDGVLNETWSSGILIKFDSDEQGEYVQCYLFLS